MSAGYVRRNGVLACEGVPLSAIAERIGTPVYVYSTGAIRERYDRLAAALHGLPVRIHYSVKANSALAILALMRSFGAGVDIVSGGELQRALLAGYSGDDIVFSGVGKTGRELERAVRAGVRSIHAESEGELRALNEIAERLGVVAPVALRVNPDIAVATPHRYTRTAERGMKFGIPQDEIVDVARSVASMSHLRLSGLAAHLGSQISDAAPYETAAHELVRLKREIEGAGFAKIDTLDLGGGLGVAQQDEPGPDLVAYARAVATAAAEQGVEVLIEPGRFLVADSGALLTRVLYRKHSGAKEVVITDAGMNDFIRPSLYDSRHAIEAVTGDDFKSLRADVVGPVCESGDFFATDRMIADVEPGELLAIRSVGAYGYSMASNYNSRPRPAEVLVDGNRFALITQRESDADLTRREILDPQWSDA